MKCDSSLLDWIALHEGFIYLTGGAVFSALVTGMPPPGDRAPLTYTWLYRTLHALVPAFIDQKKSTPPQPDDSVEQKNAAEKISAAK